MSDQKLSVSGALIEAGLAARTAAQRAASLVALGLGFTEAHRIAVQAAIGFRGRAGTAPFSPGSGMFIGNSVVGAALSTQVAAADQTRIAPWICPYDVTVDQMMMSITAGVALANLKGIIYDADAQGRPTTVIAESANIDASAAATVAAALSPSVALVGGKLYWLGFRSSSNPTINRLSGGASQPLSYTNAATPVAHLVLIATETFANPAATWVYSTAQHATGTMGLVLMRVA